MGWDEGYWAAKSDDYDKLGKKKSIQLWRFDRPHMRAFHFAWLAFLLCFITWFAIPPLYPTLKKPRCADLTSELCVKCIADFGGGDSEDMAFDKKCMVCSPYASKNGAGCGGLGLNKDQILLSNVVSVMGTIFARIGIGGVADAIGVRASYSGLLLTCAIPAFCVAATDSYDAFTGVRFLISFIGASFVLTQLWTSVMFSSNIVGTANATSAGWGNLGGGIAGALIPAVFRSFISNGYTNEQAWRYTLAWPPATLVAVGVGIWFLTDDVPQGTYSDLKKKEKERKAAADYVDDGKDTGGEEPASIAARSIVLASRNWRTWVLFVAYAYCFGVEVSVYGNLPLYFSTAYNLEQADAGLAASLFGLFNLFARSAGGILSDVLSKSPMFGGGVRGRIWANFFAATPMGIMLIIFSSLTKDANGLGGTLGCLCAWAFFLAATEGTVFGLVPFIEPTAVGGVAGIVGAGGNAGALMCNFTMRIGQRPAFNAIGWLSLWTAMLMPLLWIPGVGSMFRDDSHNAPAPVVVQKETEDAPKARDIAAPTQPQQPQMSYGYSYPGYPGMMPGMAPMGGSPSMMYPPMMPGMVGAPMMGSPPMMGAPAVYPGAPVV
jgi:NNP family nitrate/nitrite transporter-like MFS transporter